jgi:ceramide glucosyltransferase
MQQQSGDGVRCRRDADMQRDILIALAWLFCAASAAGSLYLLFAGAAVRRFAARAQRPAPAVAPVSILKPLCGEDAGLYDNLDSFCRQEYPQWQVVFGVQDSGDAAIPVVRRLIAAHPEADLVLVVESSRRDGNLKVANLQNMLPKARHDVIVIADSDMHVRPDYLADVTAPLADHGTGLVTCLYRGVSAGGLWSQLACLNINHGFLPQALVAAALGERNGCFGATIALRRDTLNAIGGLATIADSLADDHALGAAVRRLGLKVVLSPHVVDNVVAEPGLAALFRHELRWSRTIRAIAPVGFAGSILTQPMALALLALVAAPRPAMAVLALALVCRSAMVRMVDSALRLPATPLWLMPLRDLLSFAVFIATFLSRTVAWRDRTFRIGRDGQLIHERR